MPLDFDFAKALEFLRTGQRVARRGWEEGQYVQIVDSGTGPPVIGRRFSGNPNLPESHQRIIEMLQIDGLDLLATDWYFVSGGEPT